MGLLHPSLFFLLLLILPRQYTTGPLALAQQTNCSTVLAPNYDAPVVGSGWTAQLVARDLKAPRGILFDSGGALLVVQQGSGVVRVVFDDGGDTCLVVRETRAVVNNTDLNHGIQLSADGATLYASTSNEVYRWPYDADRGTIGERQTLVTNMSNTDHVSRTLLLSQKANGSLIVSRGSSENMDMAAQQFDSGHSQIRAFDINTLPAGDMPYDFPSEGRLLGWGLRNSVGVAEHPITGGIFSVENSADQVERDGADIHEDNPGEEMNFHGFLNGSTEDQGGNYGYPSCFALWGTGDAFPSRGNLTVGSQFALDSASPTLNDTTCSSPSSFVPPRLTFQAHTAPLDVLFSPDGAAAYVTFHGSWDRAGPVGYKLSAVPFATGGDGAGQPEAPRDSTDAASDVLSNADLGKCPGGCFRPVGLAWDARGRLFVSSDSTGEIYVLQRAEVSTASGGDGGSGGGGAGGTSTASGGGTLVTPTAEPNLAARSARGRPGGEALGLACLAAALSVACGAAW